MYKENCPLIADMKPLHQRVKRLKNCGPRYPVVFSLSLKVNCLANIAELMKKSIFKYKFMTIEYPLTHVKVIILRNLSFERKDLNWKPFSHFVILFI